MPKDRPPTYTPAPALPTDPEIRRRFGLVIAVLAETTTVTAAAQELDLSRNHFQTILHRTIAAMLAELTPKPAGRPAKPAREAELETENERLRSELTALQERTAAIERMLKVVGGYASGQTTMPRPRGKKSKTEDPEPALMRRVAVNVMREQGATTKLCVEALGVSPATARRARRPSTPRTKKTRTIDPAGCRQVRSILLATHCQVGAQNLSHMTRVPRRTCADIKSSVRRELEYERKARCASVRIAAPGIIRGFDAMHVESRDGKAYWLVAADAAVPYRTSIMTARAYDAAHVIAALAADFETHGAPLVLRLDRIACQRTTEVEELLTRYQVLALHGPPRHPYYYGQLERQNREHRAWYALLGHVAHRELVDAAEAMRSSLNALWPRPTLGGWTAEQAWRARTTIVVDRNELRSDVDARTRGLLSAGFELLHARRLGIESALQERGLLTINQGGWR
jgi:transposase